MNWPKKYALNYRNKLKRKDNNSFWLAMFVPLGIGILAIGNFDKFEMKTGSFMLFILLLQIAMFVLYGILSERELRPNERSFWKFSDDPENSLFFGLSVALTLSPLLFLLATSMSSHMSRSGDLQLSETMIAFIGIAFFLLSTLFVFTLIHHVISRVCLNEINSIDLLKLDRSIIYRKGKVVSLTLRPIRSTNTYLSGQLSNLNMKLEYLADTEMNADAMFRLQGILRKVRKEVSQYEKKGNVTRAEQETIHAYLRAKIFDIDEILYELENQKLKKMEKKKWFTLSRK